MAVDLNHLPDDVSTLKQLIVALDAEKENQEKLNAKLQHQLEQLLRWRYGQRSDRVSSGQLPLFEPGAAATEAAVIEEEPAAAAEAGPSAESAPKKKGHGRKPLPPDLPRERVEYELGGEERQCPQCGAECKRIGSDRGGRAAAVLVSFTHTCKSLNLDPFAYLRDILARIATHPIKNLAQLLPDHWQPLT